MSSQQRSLRTASVTLLGSLLLGVLLARVTVASGDLQSCRVRNVTQDTYGASFRTMVAAAVDGDRLTVRGTCAEVGRVIIRADLVVTGVGDPRPVLTGRQPHQVPHRVLRVGRTATVALRHLVVADGWPPKAYTTRGGTLNYGTLTITGSVVRGNEAESGGGILNVGGSTMTITESVVRGNLAEHMGGGIENCGTLTLDRSSIVTANTADGPGGGIWNNDEFVPFGSVTLQGGSTVTGNTPDDCYGTTAC